MYYWNVHDYPKAAEAFERGADIAGAPWWLRSLAATTLAKGGDRAASRLLWQQMDETANNEYARNAARTEAAAARRDRDHRTSAGRDRRDLRRAEARR